jgi:hypothetical protein
VLGFGPRLDNSASASRFANATVGAFVRTDDEPASTEIAHGRDVRQRLQARHGRHRQWRQLGDPKPEPSQPLSVRSLVGWGRGSSLDAGSCTKVAVGLWAAFAKSLAENGVLVRHRNKMW